ncbi:glycosyltransferase family protein [Candidatus Venteria ishoeyi]|uniref:Glycosyltransferase RgtA/B/C/D-like domain-containing protein n=1 Tax=Candidatus Venteria ishoeyi TaxID=1899563 RepID=A0A1H6F9E1_9GAMM|nr:hypothetical protein [Candidatus Venteria ishoeyi]SEH05614.1 Uncharacterised protein [Candidatus Venteria ishoeyi]
MICFSFFRKSFTSLFFGFISLLIITGTLVPLYISIGDWLPNFNKIILTDPNMVWYIVIVGFFTYQILVLFYKITLSNKAFYILLGILSVSFFIIKYIYVTSYEQEFYSDFRTMWDHALNIYHNGFIQPYSLQTQRPLVWLVPLVLMFGISELVFKIANIIFILLSTLIISYLISKWVSKQAAILAFLIIMLIPETYFASLIPTHDIPGTFYIVIYLFFLYTLIVNFYKISKPQLFLSVIILSFIGALIEVQRGVFSVVFISSILLIIILFFSWYKQNFKKILLVLLVIGIMPFLGAKVLIKVAEINHLLISMENMKQVTHTWGARYPHTFSDGSYKKGLDFHNNYVRPLNEISDLNYYIKAIMLSDIYYNIYERAINYLQRSSRLYALGTQAYFYYGRLSNIDKEKSKKIFNKNKKYNIIYMSVFSIFLFLSVFKLLSCKSFNKDEVFIFYPIILMSIISLALLLIGENQPRYIFMGYFFWTFIIVWFIDSIFTIPIANTNKNNVSLEVKGGWKGIIINIFFIFIGYIIFTILFTESNHKLINMETWNQLTCSKNFTKNECKRSIIKVNNNLSDKKYSTLKLMLPDSPNKGDYVRATKIFEVISGKPYTFSTYIMSPYNRNDNKKGFFQVNIYINNKLKETLSIADSNQYKYIKIKNIVPYSSSIDVTFEIVSNVTQSKNSWKRASLVYFKFASLRESL